MSDEAPTQPNLETILKEMRTGFDSINTHLSSIQNRLDIFESQLVQMDARIDRLGGIFHATRSEMLGLRADFKEFRSQFKAPA
ncbi:MAG TPA: hypothetical protein VGC66_20185 [Pyrinomonadaceae bacterium]|jgi:hypothetical protein